MPDEIRQWSEALAADPGSRVFLSLGEALRRRGQLSLALKVADRGLKRHPTDGEALELMARIRADASREQERQAVNGNGHAAVVPEAGAPTSRVRAQDLFADIIADGEQAALLLDADGLVLAGTYVVDDQRDVAAEVGAALTGISDEAQRAMRHLALGEWSAITVETDAALIAISPTIDRGVALVAASRGVPQGLVRRTVARVRDRALAWLASQNGAGA